MALEWREAAERMDVYLRERLSSGLLFLHAELGVDVGLKAEQLPPGLLACVASGLALLVALLLWFPVCRCFSKKPAVKVEPEAGKTPKPKCEEVKKRSRKRGGDKKVQRNGLAVDLEEDPKPSETQNQNESPDPAEGKSDKGKKNKKKAKAAAKETNSTSTSERKEHEEAGTWETKVSQREKRQQRRKDKGAGDESGSPGGMEPNTEHTPAVEEPDINITPSVINKTSISTTSSTITKATNNSKTINATNTKTPNTPNTKNPNTTNTKTSITTNATNTKTSNTSINNKTSMNTTANISTTKTSKTTTNIRTTKTSITPAPKSLKNVQRTQQGAPLVEQDPLVAELTPAVIPAVSHVWDVNGSGSWDLGVSVPPHTQTWNSVKSDSSAWPQDMEGSWMIVDSSHIPVSLQRVTAGAEAVQVVSERPWSCPDSVDDEWSGPNRGSADPTSDYCAPCEEWGNYEEPAGGAVSPDEPQNSDPEKDKDDTATPGSSKAKKKKKKKKKVEETGTAAQVDVGVVKDSSETIKETGVPPPVPLKHTEHEAPPNSTAPPTQRKPEESWDSPKQVKKKRARRET